MAVYPQWFGESPTVLVTLAGRTTADTPLSIMVKWRYAKDEMGKGVNY